MDIERHDGTTERRVFGTAAAMMAAAAIAAEDKNVKKITLNFPRPRIPGGKTRAKRRRR